MNITKYSNHRIQLTVLVDFINSPVSNTEIYTFADNYTPELINKWLETTGQELGAILSIADVVYLRNSEGEAEIMCYTETENFIFWADEYTISDELFGLVNDWYGETAILGTIKSFGNTFDCVTGRFI
jgi:hypothetical protein